MAKPIPDVPLTSAKPAETLWNHDGHLRMEFGQDGANCRPLGTEFYGGEDSGSLPPVIDSEY